MDRITTKAVQLSKKMEPRGRTTIGICILQVEWAKWGCHQWILCADHLAVVTDNKENCTRHCKSGITLSKRVNLEKTTFMWREI